MDFLEKLDFLMKKHNLNRNTLSQKSEIPYTTIDNWYKRGYDGLKLATLRKLSKFFNTTLDYWVDDDIADPEYGMTSNFDISYKEIILIEKYRFISNYSSAGTKMVNSVIDREYEIAQQFQTQADRIKELENNPIVVEKEKDTIVRLYTYMHKIASAGNGFYFDDIPTDTIEAPYLPGADFIIGVNGDSMEPTYKDGDLVYVEKRQIIEVGEIGVFILNNECFIKEAGEKGLISHNEKYDMIPGTEKIQCIGKVLGKVEIN